MVVTIIGARPQFVKAAVVSKALMEKGIPGKIIHTGQHYDEKMSDIFWKELGIPPYEINLNVGSGHHGEQTAVMITKIELYLLKHRDDVKCVLLYGDTNSTLAGAIAASKLGIPVVHIEAGLRSFNRAMPEEINRIITDHIADFLFCPSEGSVSQLKSEGVVKNVYNVGDVMYDAMLTFAPLTGKQNIIDAGFVLPDRPFILLTVHRPSNTDILANLHSILSAVADSGYDYLWPIHPRTKKVLSDHGISIPSNIMVAQPLSYLEILYVLQRCEKLITDSGGMQKEAYWMKKPCITLRNETEWKETLENNWNILTGPDANKITAALSHKTDAGSWKPLYGEGNASVQIVSILKEQFFP